MKLATKFLTWLMAMPWMAETQERNVNPVWEQALTFLDVRNGLQLEHVVIIMDEEDKNCKGNQFLDYHRNLHEEINGKYWLYLSKDINGTKLENTLVRRESSFIIVFDLYCSKNIQNVISSLANIRFTRNMFLFIENSRSRSNFVKDYWETQFDSKWREEFSSLQSQIYIVEQQSKSGNLQEIYKTCNGKQIITRKLATFSNGTVQIVNKNMIWQRRKDLSGCSLRVAYINRANYFYELGNSTEEIKTKETKKETNLEKDFHNLIIESSGKQFYGLDRKVFTALHSILNFSIIWVHAPDNNYGAYNKTSGKWNGIVRVLANNEADMSPCWLTVTSLRGQVVTYAESLYYGSYKLYMRKPEPTTSWSTYVNVFDIGYWVTLILALFGSSLILMIGFTVATGHRPDITPIKKGLFQNFLSGLSATLLGMAAQDVYLAYNISSNTFKSIRMLLLATCFFGMINYYVYNGALISFLMVRNYAFPIKELSDFFLRTNYGLLVPGNGAERMYLEHSFDLMHQNLWKKSLREDGNIYELYEAEKIIKEDANKVLFGPSPEFEMLFKSFPCEITSTGFSYGYRQLAFPFKKKSPLIRLFNYHIARIMESGLETHQEHINRRSTTKCYSEETDMFRVFTYKDVVPAFVVSGIGCFVAIIYVIIERLHSIYMCRPKTK